MRPHLETAIYRDNCCRAPLPQIKICCEASVKNTGDAVTCQMEITGIWIAGSAQSSLDGKSRFKRLPGAWQRVAIALRFRRRYNLILPGSDGYELQPLALL